MIFSMYILILPHANQMLFSSVEDSSKYCLFIHTFLIRAVLGELKLWFMLPAGGRLRL